MTKSRFYFYQAYKALGGKIAQRRLADATHEMHLLKDAQELIGYYNCENTEHIDELKTEYWEIKKLRKLINDLEDKEEAISSGLSDAIGKSGKSVSEDVAEQEALDNEINSLVDEREDYLEKRTEVFNEGKRVRKVYDGLQAKMNYFMDDLEESDPERVDTAKRLEDCIAELTFLKGERDSIVNVIGKVEEKIHTKEEALQALKTSAELESFTNYSDVGEKNKKLSELRSKRAAIQNDLDKNIRYVGRFLYANKKDKEVNSCIKSHRELVYQATELRKSIILNHRLVDRSRVELFAEE